MKTHLRIQQLSFELSGGSGRVITGEATGSENVRTALRMVTDAISAPRARARDPQTSHDAAARAIATATVQRTKIAAVIVAAGERGACAREIEKRTGLTVVQVNRRVLEIEGIERRLRKGASSERDFQRRDGCSIWWAKV